MGYGKERPCKKCSEIKLIQARGLCQSCFSEEKKAGTLENWPPSRTVTPKTKIIATWDDGHCKLIGEATTVGELKAMLETYPADTSFGFRNQPMQALHEVRHGETVVVVFQ